MCGMAGAYCPSLLSGHEIRKLQKLLVLNHWRGDDSVGMFDYIKEPKSKKTEDLLYWKSPEHPIRFAYSTFEKTIETRWKENPVNAIAVHCRAATIGEVNKQNCHPFYFPNVIGMHNGTVTKDFKDKDKFGTDSEAIYSLINDMPFDKALKEIGYGAYALVWMDFRDNTLNFYRNSQRPLHGYIGNTNTLYWSSDLMDLRYTFGYREKLENLSTIGEGKTEFKKDCVFEFPVNEHISINMGNSEFSYTAKTVYHYDNQPYVYKRGDDWNDNFFTDRTSLLSGPSTKRSDDTNPYIEKLKELAKKQNKTITFEWMKPVGACHGLDYLDRIAKNKKDIWNNRFAIEFCKWFSRETYALIQKWRAEYPKLFVEKLTRSFMLLTKQEQKEALNLVGLSRNELRRLLSFKSTDYIFVPYHIDENNNRVYNEYIIQTYRTRAVWYGAEDAKFTVIEGSKDSPYTLGVSKRPVSKSDYISFLKDNACAYCGDPISEHEDLYWIDERDYICEGCQEAVVEQGRHHLLFALFPNHQPDEIKRHIEARNPIRQVG